jgi:mono/diheme cytochrome c family protein
MRRVLRAATALLTAAAVGAGCAAIPHATPEDAARAAALWSDATQASLEAGRSRYVARCSSCHSLRRPARYPAVRWERYLDKMGDRAKLTPDDHAAILRYLVTMADRPPTR